MKPLLIGMLLGLVNYSGWKKGAPPLKTVAKQSIRHYGQMLLINLLWGGAMGLLLKRRAR